jgi:two-component system sensor histidine kinase YesM
MKHRRLGDLSLKYKISVIPLLLAVIPLLGFALSTTYLFERAILQRSNRHIEENSRIMARQVEAVFRDGELCSNYLTLNIGRLYAEQRTASAAKLQNDVLAQLNQSVLIFNGISSIVFVTQEDQIVSTSVALYQNSAAIVASDYLAQLRDRNGKTVLFDLGGSCMSQDGQAVVTQGKRVIDTVTGRTLGYLFINLDVDYLQQSVQNSISEYLLYDAQGSYVSGGSGVFDTDAAIQARLYADTASSLRYGGTSYLVGRCTVEGCGWTVVGVTDLNQYNVSGREMATILLATGAVVLLMLAVEIQLAANSITRPLLALTRGAAKIGEGDLTVRFSFRTHDEIGRLGEILNQMCGRIQELLARVETEAAQKRAYELALIQEQVKPHFLYNTLDIIIMLIDMGRGRDAQRVTRKLASYYKNSLSESQEVIPLERELTMVQEYLELQLMRYGDKFTFSIDPAGDLAGVPIPKMTLQPLVENAIYHGLKYRENWGNIHVGVCRAQDTVLLTVADNGIGIPPEKMAGVQALLDSPQQHFGIYSVNHRLKLYFGEGYGITLESEYEKGTSVTVRIPCKKGGDAACCAS